LKLISIENELRSNSYPGRGIILGRTPCGKKAAAAYFIMGRSENSRNRVFVKNDLGGIKTKAFDAAKMTAPALVIYNAVRTLGTRTIISNGDQTDTIYNLMNQQMTFEQALRTREFEPDAPNYTPRISGVIKQEEEGFNYALSILKTDDGNPDCCQRHTFSYKNPIAGIGHFIHTYSKDGEPLPSFEGEPKKIEIPACIDEFTALLWGSLNEENKVSLFVRYISFEENSVEDRIMNKLGN